MTDKIKYERRRVDDLYAEVSNVPLIEVNQVLLGNLQPAETYEESLKRVNELDRELFEDEMSPSPEDLMILWEICKAFIVENEITCPETLEQSDQVLENIPKLVDAICDLVGFVEDKE
jgi:hypothetical protein